MAKVITPFDLSSCSPLRNLFKAASALSIREPGALEYDTGLAKLATGSIKPICPFDLASYSALVNVATSSAPATDMRGQSIQGAARDRGALERDAALGIAAATKLVSSYDISCESALVNRITSSAPTTDLRGQAVVSAARCITGHNNFSPTTTDLRGTAAQEGRREIGATEYDSTLAITGGGLVRHPGMGGGLNG